MTPRFSLQPVLDYRHTHVEVLEVELGRVQHLKKDANDLLEKLNGRQQALNQELSSSQSDGEIDLVKVDQVRVTLKRVAARIDQQKQRIADLTKKEEDQRAVLVTAKQDEEALSTLKDKEAARYKASEDSKELRLQDDIYISQAYRRSSGENQEK